MDDHRELQLNREEIEYHLKSAVDTLTPDILGRIDLSAPQDVVVPLSGYWRLKRRMHMIGTAAAACFCAVLITSGVYAYQNKQVESVIGIDVNPSIELSVNRKDKILSAQALNTDAVEIIDGMDLKGVDLDIAVNAIIGSMVKHGYLQDLDNAILVTVNNDSVSKARDLRTTVVEDIQDSLKENQVEAVVYDQQAVETDEVKTLAQQYGISYGKAYFLEELINQSPELTMGDMGRLSTMTMEEIAKEIGQADEEEKKAPPVVPETKPVVPSTPSEAETVPESESGTNSDGSPVKGSEAATPTAPETTAPEPTTQAVVTEGRVSIDYADYDGGRLIVHFKKKVKWKNPTVSVTDESGNAYSALVEDTSSDSCQIQVDSLEEGMTYTFVLGGVFQSGSSKGTTVSGTFETPIVSVSATQESTEEQTEEEDDDEEEETQVRPTKPEETEESIPPSSAEETLPEETSGISGEGDGSQSS